MIHPQILSTILEPDVSIGVILGGRRKGKSVLGYGIVDALHNEQGYSTYIFGLPESKQHYLPSFIKPIFDLDMIPDGSALLVDEAYKEFYSRMSFSTRNKFIDTLVALSGQKRLKCLFITQEARKLEIGITGSSDFILFKKPSMLQIEFDRPQFKRMLTSVRETFEQLKSPANVPLKEYEKQCTYIVSDDFIGMIEKSNSPPAWWNEEISRAYSGVSLIDKKKTEKQIVSMISRYIGGKQK
jgi:hypothetical protein